MAYSSAIELLNDLEMKAIAAEAKTDPELVRTAPHRTRLRRLDETRAARRPILRWWPAKDPS